MTPPILIALDQIPVGALRLASDGDDVNAGENAAGEVDAGEVDAGEVEVGELLTVVVVMAANVVRDIRENIRNLVGGRMSHYEKLIQNAIDMALADLQRKAQAKGYDGVVGVKISHPVVVEGGVEVIAYGNGFWLRKGKG